MMCSDTSRAGVCFGTCGVVARQPLTPTVTPSGVLSLLVILCKPQQWAQVLARGQTGQNGPTLQKRQSMEDGGALE